MAKKQQDNSTFDRKAQLRINALREVNSASVVETHGGFGKIFATCYAHLRRGVVFETDPDKASALACQRAAWAVYETDCAAALVDGVGFHLEPNFFDIDPYGECWPVIDAIFAGMPTAPQRLVLVVNDGLRQKLKMNGGWSCNSMSEIVQERGNGALYGEYLDVCQELVKRKAAKRGYALGRWAGYYCGYAKQMTHFAAVLDIAG